MSAESENTENIIYAVEAPGVLRSNAHYNVIVTIFEAPEACGVKICLRGGDFQEDKILNIEPKCSEMCTFEIPNLSPKYEYYLDVEGLDGVSFKESSKLRFKEGRPLVYIQCDKQAYKRGDKVDYRVCLLDQEELKPVTPEIPLNIRFNFLDEFVLEQSDCQFKNGLYVGQWLIPNDVRHGSYDIEVYIGDRLLAAKSFEVIDYRPPEFEIEINTVKELLYTDRQFYVETKASYPDGSPVNGICRLDLETVAGYFSGVCIEKSMPIRGKTAKTIVDVVDDLDIQSSFMEYDWFSTATVMVRATITAENGQHVESLTKMVTVKQKKSSTNGSYDRCGESCPLKKFTPEPEEESPIKIFGPEENIRVGEPINFKIALLKPAKSVIYFIIARGNIIKSELIEVEDSTAIIERSVEATFKYVPRAFILAYFIYEGVLYFNEMGFNLTREFENQLEVTVPEKVDPGSDLTIQVKSAPNSLVAIMAVDENSVLLKAKNDFRYKQFFDDLFHIRSQTSMLKGCGKYPGLMPGLLTITNATIDGYELANEDDGFCNFFDREHFKIESRMPCVDTDVRKNEITRANQELNQVFGNWLFIENETDDNGDLQLETTLPSKSTNWLLTVFSLSNEKGFSMTEKPLQISAKETEEPVEQKEITAVTIAIPKVIAFVVDHYESEASKNTIAIEPPKDSETVEISFSITENLFGSTIADLQFYAGVMYCTGHLHMTNMIPNIVVLEYLDEMNQLDSEFAVSIKERFPKAIERELSERREDDGAFSWFASDANGSPHVTSLVMQAFQRLSKYVEVDSEVIARGLEYLSSHQLESGEIEKEDQPYKYPFEKDIGVGLTSMVLLAFLQSEEVKEQYKSTIDKGFEYIIANIEYNNCIYDLALAFYAMQLAEHPLASSLKERLFSIAKTDPLKNHMWWTYSVEPDSDPDFYQPISDLEVTSYILLGLLITETTEILLPIVKWLLPLRNCGNETMDRAVALSCALKAATKFGAALAILNVDYTAIGPDDEYTGRIISTPENSSKILTHILPASTKEIEFSTQDIGTFFGQVCFRYKTSF